MSGSAWYKRYPADFLHSTAMLSCEEKGAYGVLLDLMYERGGPIADDAGWIARVCGCSQRKWTQSLRPRLIALGKINVTEDGKLSNGRMLYETHASAERIKVAREAGRKGAKAKNAPINHTELWDINDVASAKPDAIDEKPATNLSPIYRPDKFAIIEPKPNENNQLDLADSGLRKIESLVPSESSTNNPGSPTHSSRTRKKPRAASERVSMASFAAWFAEYPIHDAEVPARIEYARALRKASPDELLDGLRRYPFRDDPRYQPFAARWLHEERWRSNVAPLIDPALRAAGITPEMLARENEAAATPQLLAIVGGRR
jgi:uncharacterized protein YdaU (DUF1376 family)